MDVENSEWATLCNMISEGELEKTDQFLVEYHRPQAQVDAKLDVVKNVELKGFKKFFIHKNVYCKTKIEGYPGFTSSCLEVHYVRRPNYG